MIENTGQYCQLSEGEWKKFSGVISFFGILSQFILSFEISLVQWLLQLITKLLQVTTLSIHLMNRKIKTSLNAQVCDFQEKEFLF